MTAGSNATATVARMKPMTGNATKELGSAAALLANRITSLDADGFTVGGNVSVNQAGAGFLGVYLVPFLKYPASPPAVGSADADACGLASVRSDEGDS